MNRQCLITALLWLLAVPVPGQEAPAPATDQDVENRAFLRGWIFPGGDKRAVALTVTLQEDEAAKVIVGTKDAAARAQPGYAPLAPGSLKIELKSGDEVLASKTGTLRPEQHYTAVAWIKGGKWDLQVFADDPASPNATDRPLRVINFAGGRETLLSTDGGAETKVAADTVQELRGPRKVSMVRVQVLAPDGGPPAQSSVEVDLRSVPSVYVVVGPDYRGRMRPRIILGGQPPEEFAEGAELAGEGQR